MTETISTTLARFALELDHADLPPAVLEKAATHLLDATGTAIAATRFDFSRVIDAAVGRLAPTGPCHTLAMGRSTSTAYAALSNGTMIHGLDFDDTHIAAIYHASGPAAATAYAVGYDVDATAAEVLTAYAVGLEVGCRLAGVGAGEFHARFFHPTSVIGTFAAACVAARLRRLDRTSLVRAIGLCGSMGSGVLEIVDSWQKRFHPGWAAHAGVTAAEMGAAGFKGHERVLEGSQGLFAAFLGQVPAGIDDAVADLGTRWELLDIAIKPYPCCHFLHASIDAAYAVGQQLAETGRKVDDIATIQALLSPPLIQLVAEPREVKSAPPTAYDALFSVQYAVATALVTKAVTLDAFYGDTDASEVVALARRIEVLPDTESDFPARFPGEVRVRTVDGAELGQRVTSSVGTPGNPLGWDGVAQKFHANAAPVLGDDGAARIESMLRTVDGVRCRDVIDASVPAGLDHREVIPT